MKANRGRERKSRLKRTRSTTMIEIVKPPADSRGYRVVILPNGITAMLISEASDFKQEGIKNADTDSDHYIEDGEAAAALCIGIGSFSDLPEIPGFAHFMEHMVFMGSKKFPKENYWDDFLAQNGGDSNAWTDCERTCFFFVCQQSSFLKALDIFAHFFISPLFNKQSVDKEIMAVDNEFQMVASNDNERMRSVISYELVEPGHVLGKFMAGNKKSLKDDPERNNINVYEQLHTFYNRMYSAHYMTLAVHSIEDLDSMEHQVIKIFSNIPNNHIPCPKFIKPPFQEKKLNALVRVVPIADVHKMEIVWALPPLMEHYRARVIEYLSLLLGHEAAGSILSVLHRKHLALELSGGNDMTGYTHNSTWSAFIISVKLTELGISQFEQVLEIIFQYIKLLKVSLPGHVFEEQKHIQETKYIFKEQESIYSYVEELAENMHLFPPEHYLCGRDLFFEYNEQLIRDCLDFLRPRGMLVMLFNKDYQSLPSQSVEPWLGTKYMVKSIDDNLIQQLENVKLNPDLNVPIPNPYIATDFGLKKIKKATKFPVVVMNEPGIRIWYKKDNKYHMPTAYIYFHFISSAISRNPVNVALGDVYLTLLLQMLTETLYNATLAGFEYSIEGTPEGIIFILGGYSEKIKLVVTDTVKVFLDFQPNEDSFDSVLTHLKQVYVNELIKPVELARAVRYSVLELKDPSLQQRYQHMHNISYPMLLDFIEEFYSSLFIEGFVTGNVLPQEAIDVGKMAFQIIRHPLSSDSLPKPNMMELPVGDFKIFLSAINKEDTNSCVVHYFQLGLGNVYNICLNDLLYAAMNEPLFNVLRTEYQLGYSVYCQPTITHGILGFLIAVESQANKFSMKSIDELMTKFLVDFEKTLSDTPDEQFNEMVRTQSSIRAAEDADMYDESNNFWQEIVKQSYCFERVKLEYDAMQHINKASVMSWLKNLVGDNKRKLSIMVEGCCHSTVEAPPPPPTSLLDSPLKGIRSLIQDLKNNKTSGSKLPSTLNELTKCQNLLEVHHFGENYIANLADFKLHLKTLPYHIINK
ncbi:nardilysin [Biomphalaria glabrata]|nr:nardilysin [Biomphalaria glabrata]